MKHLPSLLVAVLLIAAGCSGSGQMADEPAADEPSQSETTDGDDIRRSEFALSDITYPDLRSFQIPDAQRVELENGMTVFLIEDRELPQVSAVARLGAGGVYAPADHAGLAGITGTVMRSGGTASMTSDEVNQALENVGATVETSIGETSGSAFMSTLKENVGTVLPIFVSVLSEPAFAEDKIELAKSQSKTGISRRNDNPQQIAFREFSKIVYGEDSPYARTSEYYTIDEVSREDAVQFYDQYVHPNNTILSVYGDFDATEMEQTIREAFAGWEMEPGFEQPELPTPTGDGEYSVSFIPKEDVTQSTILMGHIGEMTRDNPDYFPVIVMNEVLSGGFTSRLFQTVRTDLGLAYAVFGSYGAGYDRPGTFQAGTFTKSESTIRAAEAVMGEIEKLRQDAPTESEVQLAKDAYLNSFVFNFDTRREIAGRLMTYDYYGYPRDFLEQTRQGVAAVTPADVQRVAQKYLHPDELDILVLGKQDAFDQAVSSLAQGGAVNEIDISIPTSAPGSDDAAPASEEDMAAGRDRMTQVVDAMGGAEAFAQVETMKAATRSTVQSPGGEQTIESTLVVALPQKIHAGLTMPNGLQLTIVDDGEQMMIQTPGGTQPAPPPVRQQITGQVQRNLVYLMAQADNPDWDVTSRGMVDVDGTEMPALRVTPASGDAFTLLLDPETMRPARMRYRATNPQTGAPVASENVYGDYREVSGVMVPFETVTLQNGEQASTSTFTSFEINADLEDGLFSMN